MRLALAIVVGSFFWGCVAFVLLSVTIGEPFLDCITQLAWRLK